MRPKVMMPWPQKQSHVQMVKHVCGQTQVEDLDEEGNLTKPLGVVRLQCDTKLPMKTSMGRRGEDLCNCVFTLGYGVRSSHGRSRPVLLALCTL